MVFGFSQQSPIIQIKWLAHTRGSAPAVLPAQSVSQTGRREQEQLRGTPLMIGRANELNYMAKFLRYACLLVRNGLLAMSARWSQTEEADLVAGAASENDLRS